MKRQQGYYWVKTKNGQWNIAHYTHALGQYFWEVHWHKFSCKDDEFLEIDENIIERKKN